jgi:hypothetical protein
MDCAHAAGGGGGLAPRSKERPPRIFLKQKQAKDSQECDMQVVVCVPLRD